MTLAKVIQSTLCVTADAEGFGTLLGQLTDASGLNDKTFSLAFDELLAANQNHLRHFVVIIEDTVQHKIVATGSLLVERKFTRGTGLVRFPAI